MGCSRIGGCHSDGLQRLAEHDFNAAEDRGLGVRTDLGGKQDQQRQDRRVTGDRQKNRQPDAIHCERGPCQCKDTYKNIAVGAAISYATWDDTGAGSGQRKSPSQ